MKQFIALAAFVLCFGVGTAHAQRTGGGVAGGGNGRVNGGGGASGGAGGGGGSVAGVTHHAVWVPPRNVSAKNDGPFLPSSYQSYDKAIETGKAEVGARQPSVVEVARMAQEQKMATAKARFIVVQGVDGRLQEVKAQP